MRRGLIHEAVAAVIERAAHDAWREIREHHDVAANAARAQAYRDRLALSRDPWASEDAVARRAVVGLRIQAALRKRERIQRLKSRAAGAAAQPAALSSNVTLLRRRP